MEIGLDASGKMLASIGRVSYDLLTEELAPIQSLSSGDQLPDGYLIDGGEVILD